VYIYKLSRLAALQLCDCCLYFVIIRQKCKFLFWDTVMDHVLRKISDLRMFLGESDLQKEIIKKNLQKSQP